MGHTDRLVLWDFDGTLAERPGKWSQTLIEALSTVVPGHDLAASDLRPHLGRGFPWQSPTLRHPFAGDPNGWWHHLSAVFRSAFLAIGCTAEESAAAAESVRERYLDAARWHIYPDSLRNLDRLAEAGWQNSIVSNHVPELESLIAQLGFQGRFRDVVSSGSFGQEKPLRGIFVHAVALAGSPQRVHMVGDNPIADVDGAEAADITGHHLIRSPDGDLGEPSPLDIIVDRILDAGASGGGTPTSAPVEPGL